MKIAAFYARVSTGKQKKEETIDSQIAEVEAKILKDGNIIGNGLKFQDDGWSGEGLARPALDALRDAIKNKLIQVLYVYDLGRLSRNYTNQLVLIDEIQDAGIELISLHDIVANKNDDDHWLQGNIMGLFHAYERKKIVERFRRGKLYKAKNGVLFGWEAPYGYTYIKGDKKKGIDGKFETAEEEAEIIKQIFYWVGVEGLTIRKVIKRLFEKNMLPRKSKNGYWSTSTLSKRLRDTTYIGLTHYNKTISVIPENPFKNEKYKRIKKSSRKEKSKKEWFPIKVPAIIEPELFQAVQRQLILNDKFAMRNKKNNYLLSGLNYCSCGQTRAGEGNSKTGNIYYRCSDRVHRFPLPKQCHLKGVNATVLDNTVWNELFKLLTNRKLIEEQFEIWQKQSNLIKDDTDFLKKELEKKLNHIEEEEKSYIHAHGKQVMTLEQLQTELNRIKPKKEQIMSELSKCSNSYPISQQSQPLNMPDLEEYCSKMKAVLENRSFEKKLPIVRKTINKVITDGKIAVIQGQIPLEVLKEYKENVGSQTEYRYHRTAECWKKYFV